MKKLITILLLGMLPPLVSQAQIKWVNFEDLDSLQKVEQRGVIVDVYADWCSWCKKMDKETFSDTEVGDFVNGRFYAVKLNAESKRPFIFKGETYTEQKMAQTMMVSSYPTIVFIDAALENIFHAPGYRDKNTFLLLLKQVHENQTTE
ncbi:thioredoxin family protein [Penaeicola halotolerans]|uniref:thioredoxin family protein n=1 Tax=Penaeicola halotolerans TaxID=2793196 RepID=UPI001CF87AD9|nr:thioredoxin fold domain-containing protein [Penaeicola halotolerans]